MNTFDISPGRVFFTGKLKTESGQGVPVVEPPIFHRQHGRWAYHVALEPALLTDAARHAVQRQPARPRPPILALYDDADAPLLPERLIIALLALTLVESPYLIAKFPRHELVSTLSISGKGRC